MAARLETIEGLGRRFFREMMPPFERLQEAIETEEERSVLDEIYDVMPRYNFSSDLLQRGSEHVAVMRLRGVAWSDWGRPERIAETLRRLGKTPAFLQQVAAG